MKHLHGFLDAIIRSLFDFSEARRCVECSLQSSLLWSPFDSLRQGNRLRDFL